ncbi:hypothetical protein E2C01_085544 [Portunus trituberculatus]|uniref:Uncharacterized protein n=1 Tax=Portunus trituberculatus TaxID=210409 RepID=A0A5B7IYD5_PORTR|nr:hypothetical protein [Portunus trituberculatus]
MEAEVVGGGGRRVEEEVGGETRGGEGREEGTKVTNPPVPTFSHLPSWIKGEDWMRSLRKFQRSLGSDLSGERSVEGGSRRDGLLRPGEGKEQCG